MKVKIEKQKFPPNKNHFGHFSLYEGVDPKHALLAFRQ